MASADRPGRRQLPDSPASGSAGRVRPSPRRLVPRTGGPCRVTAGVAQSLRDGPGKAGNTCPIRRETPPEDTLPEGRNPLTKCRRSCLTHTRDALENATCFGSGVRAPDEKGTAVRPVFRAKSAAAPATVSGERSRKCHCRYTRWEGPAKRRPASQETCRSDHPVRARGALWTTDPSVVVAFHRPRKVCLLPRA